jgi:hypothetical protein
LGEVPVRATIEVRRGSGSGQRGRGGRTRGAGSHVRYVGVEI